MFAAGATAGGDDAPSVAEHAWWLASRASGLVALALVTISVVLGLTDGGALARAPGHGRAC